jgi:hypothetical protein
MGAPLSKEKMTEHAQDERMNNKAQSPGAKA